MLRILYTFLAVILFFHKQTTALEYKVDSEKIRDIYLDKLLIEVGGAETKISVNNLNQYFVKHSLHTTDNTNLTKCILLNETSTRVQLDKDCLLSSCLSPSDVLELSGLVNSQNVTTEELSTLSAILVHLYENSSCMLHDDKEAGHHRTHHIPSSAEAWGYGFLLVTGINLCSLGGLFVLPFIHHSLYKKILIFMIALAVGTLSGSSLLFLIPQAFELEDGADNHRWKSVTVIVGIYVFFNIERILKMIMDFRKIPAVMVLGRSLSEITVHGQYGKIDQQKSDDPAAEISTFHEAPPAPNADYKDVDKLPKYATPCGDNNIQDSSESASSLNTSFEDLQNSEAEIKRHTGNNSQNGLIKHSSHGHHHKEDKPVATVAWMVIFGDGIHNFIDGVSIGAAFTESILAGLSVSLAIFCEELPHELGDFAVLLNAGMKLKRAVMYNFLSACMCYLGMAVGIVLGENTTAHAWVFAFAGGMFLYISLVDMMPEMNSCGESEENKKQIGEKFIYLLQNLGLLTGFGIMLVMALYGENISFE